MTTFLQQERDGAVWTVTMNQPATRNALTGNTAVQEFVDLCEAVARDSSVRVVIVTGAEPVFSSGGNVKDMTRFFDEALTASAIREEYRQAGRTHCGQPWPDIAHDQAAVARRPASGTAYVAGHVSLRSSHCAQDARAS